MGGSVAIRKTIKLIKISSEQHNPNWLGHSFRGNSEFFYLCLYSLFFFSRMTYPG